MDELEAGRLYPWEELGELFGFAPNYLGAAGGMVSRPNHNALLLISHPGGAKSFDYDDYWDGDDLVYTGRGKTGDQRLEGQNRDVAENAKQLLVFEPAGSRKLLYLGICVCLDHWEATGTDDNGNERKILRFHLSFEEPIPKSSEALNSSARRRDPPRRRPRKLRSSLPAPPKANTKHQSREETLALQEKANEKHHMMLLALEQWLQASGWTEIEEIPSAIDLWARHPTKDGRVIFEAKTIHLDNEVSQSRSGLSQLLEYRFFFGSPEDELCLVCDSTLSDSRIRFLEDSGVAVLSWNGQSMTPVGVRYRSMLA